MKSMTDAEKELRRKDRYTDNDMPASLFPDSSPETDAAIAERLAKNEKIRKSYKAKEAANMKGTKKMAKGGMACGTKKMARGGMTKMARGGMTKMARGGKVRGAGMAKKGVRPCKMR